MPEPAVRIKSNAVEPMDADCDSEHPHSSLDLTYPEKLVFVDLGSREHPLSWSMRKKLTHTLLFGVTTLSAQFSSTVIAPGAEVLSSDFGVGTEIGVLAMSIYVLGNGVGPMLFAPLSELHGRKIGVFVPYFISAILMLVIANLNSIGAIVVFRFFAGVFAAAPIVSSGGAMADMWNANSRAAALVLYGLCIVCGSTVGPIFGALLINEDPGYGWRWCCWLGGIMGVIISMGNFFFLDETYLPVIEQKKAAELRHDTGRWEFHAKHEEWRFSLDEFIKVHCARPIMMFMTPIVFLMALYASFVYGVLFLIITSVGENFHKYKGFSPNVSNLPLLASFLGFVVGGGFNILNSNYYARKSKATGGEVNPEDRLPAMMMLNWALPAGCFIYAWTMSPHVHWIVPCIGLFFVNVGVAVIFQGALVYMVDAYTRYAASAIAANTLLRSIFGGVFPLFARQLYKRLGPGWGSSLVGFVAVLMLPIPFGFYFFGGKVRAHNPYAAKLS